MKAEVSFNQLGHQSIESAAAGGDQLQNLFAFPSSLQGAFDGLGLTF